jgi:putative FmdB family regulatory protein
MFPRGEVFECLGVLRYNLVMPIYEYTCHDCQRRVSLLWRSFADAQEREAVCPRCGGKNLTRLISRVAVVRSESSRLDATSDDLSPDSLPDLDENDPKSLARFMRKMADETGEDLGDEFEEVVGRLEAGEDPESIEQSMPDLGSSPSSDDFGVM